MTFRDLQKFGAAQIMGLAAHYVVLIASRRDQDRGAAALQSPDRARARGKRGDLVRHLTPQATLQGLILTFILSALSTLAAAHTVQLSWDASNSQNVIGYNVFRGANPGGPYSQINSTLDPNTCYSDSTVQGGQTYYYVTTAVNSDNTQSEYSNQTEAVIPSGGAGSENALYSFAGGNDPKLPYAGLVFDKAGNLYGTTELGGTNNHGTVFEIIPNSNGTWTETVLYNFTGGSDGGQPYGSLVFDTAGNLYGTTNFGGSSNCNMGCGTVFELSPVPAAGLKPFFIPSPEAAMAANRQPESGWTPPAIFTAQPCRVETSVRSCSAGCGTVFKLTHGSSGWSESVLYAFQGGSDGASSVRWL